MERLRDRPGPERLRRHRLRDAVLTGRPVQERALATRRRILDAAVDALLADGYARLTTVGVARRAGVSRGALQHHFPGRAELLAAAVRHLAERQLAELEAQFPRAASSPPRLARVLDLLFAQYSGPLFGLVLELTLAARADPGVHAVVAEQEQAINRAITRALRTTLGGALPASHLALALAAARGTAVLLLLGHPRGAVERRWAVTRRDLVALLGSGAAAQAGRK